MYQLMLLQDLSEILQYPNPRLQIRAYRGQLREYINQTIPTHWHNEFEFIITEGGIASYRVNEREYLMKSGQALFINSNRLHYGSSGDGGDFTYAVLHTHPSAMSTNPIIGQKYFNSLLCDADRDAVLLSPDVPWQRECIDALRETIALTLEPTATFELQAIARLYHIFSLFGEHDVIRLNHNTSTPADILALQDMLRFIQDHYAEPLTLGDICGAGAMCRSKCCALFKSILQQSPITFLQSFRIQRASYLLASTDGSVTEIASQCGFNSPSYFVEIFRRHMDMTPKTFRRHSQSMRVEYGA